MFKIFKSLRKVEVDAKKIPAIGNLINISSQGGGAETRCEIGQLHIHFHGGEDQRGAFMSMVADKVASIVSKKIKPEDLMYQRCLEELKEKENSPRYRTGEY